MLFTSWQFPLFFASVVVGHYALSRNSHRKLWLLLASAVFYSLWDLRFLWLISFATLSEYYLALRIDGAQEKSRRHWFYLSVFKNVAILVAFKYLGFFSESLAAFGAVLGISTKGWVITALLPVGISFYTFELLSYSMDVYRRQTAPERSLLDFALFVFFFPRLVSGPILRPGQFLPQLKSLRNPSADALRSALALFLWGLTKKLVIADNLAVVIDGSYLPKAIPFTLYDYWFGVFAFPCQLYCDFSGYTDMARACGRVFGYELPLNFDLPFRSRNTTEFWRRWHISLSSWVRDYLYLPWVGASSPVWRRDLCLLACMVVMGAWHGAAWGFVVFGMLNGLFVWIHRAWKRWGALPLPAFVAIPLTSAAFAISLVPFRVRDLGALEVMLRHLVEAPAGGVPIRVLNGGYCLIFFFAVHLAWPVISSQLKKTWLNWPSWAIGSFSGTWLSLIFPLLSSGQRPFLYFQF